VDVLKNQYKNSKGQYEINNNKSIKMAVISTAYLFKIGNSHISNYGMFVLVAPANALVNESIIDKCIRVENIPSIHDHSVLLSCH